MAHQNVRIRYKYARGKRREFKKSHWEADVCAHQFQHKYVYTPLYRQRSCGSCHTNGRTVERQDDTEAYLSLKPQMVQDAGQKLNDYLKGLA